MAKMILYAAEGMPNDQIAACLDTRREVVSLWRKRFFADRLSGLEEHARPGRPRTFSPDLVVQVKALACELPARFGLPLSRWSTSGLVASVSGNALVRCQAERCVPSAPDHIRRNSTGRPRPGHTSTGFHPPSNGLRSGHFRSWPETTAFAQTSYPAKPERTL
jgi:hypothetical protein